MVLRHRTSTLLLICVYVKEVSIKLQIISVSSAAMDFTPFIAIKQLAGNVPQMQLAAMDMKLLSIQAIGEVILIVLASFNVLTKTLVYPLMCLHVPLAMGATYVNHASNMKEPGIP